MQNNKKPFIPKTNFQTSKNNSGNTNSSANTNANPNPNANRKQSGGKNRKDKNNIPALTIKIKRTVNTQLNTKYFLKKPRPAFPPLA
jgi:hypothetical protein